MKKLIQFAIIAFVVVFLSWVPARAQESIPVVNFSFEQPGEQTLDWTLIPGWEMDTPPVNTGVGNNPGVSTDGEWIAWIKSDDGSIWNLTDYVIQANDVIKLSVDFRNSWISTDFRYALYYQVENTRTEAIADTVEPTGQMETYTLTLNANDKPASIGKKLGIEFDNLFTVNAFVELDNVRLTRTTATGTENNDLPALYVLSQNYPNPARTETMIPYTLGKSGNVRLDVFNLLGIRVRTLVSGPSVVGPHNVSWDLLNDAGVRVADGIYIYRLSVESEDTGQATSRRLVVVH